MSLKRDLHYDTGPTTARTVVHVSEVMRQIELMSGIRKRIREGYYNRPDILTEVAEQLSRRVKS
ncbi:MAG TPA: hypothetical protein VGL38_10510 [bacterium]|jgi:hypothetical protein